MQAVHGLGGDSVSSPVLVGINGISPQVRRPDVADKLLILNSRRLSQAERRPEEDILTEILDHRAKLRGDYLRALQQVLIAIQDDHETFASPLWMADWATLAWKIAKARRVEETFKLALGKLGHQQAEFTIEDAPIYQTLNVWLTPENSERTLLAGELWDELREVRRQLGIPEIGGSRSAMSFSKKFSHVVASLREVGILVEKRASGWQGTSYMITRT